MFRPAFLSLALLSTPALAAGHFQAEPVARPSQATFAARDNVWRCTEFACSSNRTSTRPAIVCSTLVREVGSLRSFSVQGRAFAADELENCNRRAR